jgi:hypothetical protein
LVRLEGRDLALAQEREAKRAQAEKLYH